MKQTGTTHWNSPNTDATNTSGFTAWPGGDRHYGNGDFCEVGFYAFYWTATESGNDYVWLRQLSYDYYVVLRYDLKKQYGFSVRLVRDN